jgi:hypothetical protein
MRSDLFGRVAQGARTAARWPLEWIIAVLLVGLMLWPRRLPDLPRFARGDGFRQLQSAVAAWVEQNWALIEDGAPWLDRVGCLVVDSCETEQNSPGFISIPLPPPSLACTRAYTVVYGTDGTLQERLTRLPGVLAGAGWDNASLALPSGKPLEFWGLRWSPVPALGFPARPQALPPEQRFPHWTHMRVTWGSRGEPTDNISLASLAGAPKAATVTYQPVEVRGSDLGHLVAQALTRHRHAIAISISVCYYFNANVNVGPGRPPKKLLPAWPR